MVGSNTFTVQVASGDGQTDTQQLTITVATTAILQPNELCSDYPDSAIATFEDANLEAAIRTALSVGAQEDLTCGLISGLTALDASTLGITSLVGIQNLTGLTTLDLSEQLDQRHRRSERAHGPDGCSGSTAATRSATSAR